MTLTDRRSILKALGAASLAALLEGGSCGAVPEAAGPAGGAPTASDGRSDDAVPLQAAIDRLSAAGGGELALPPGAVTVASIAPVVKPDVVLNLNGGTLLLVLHEHNATGVRLRSNATLKNGTVQVRSSGRPSLQGAAHAPVVVGPLYGEGGTPDAISPEEGVGGWTIRDLILASDKRAEVGDGNWIGAPAIQIMGGAHDGLIENIEIPDSAVMAGGIHLDWGFVGPISSDTIEADDAAFRAGRAFTTHPHAIVVRNIRIGRLSLPSGRGADGSFGIRLSGVHDVSVSDVTIVSVTGAAFYHTAGDLGFEFAPDTVKPRACLGIRISGGTVREASTAYLIWSNSYADNVGRAAARGYHPIIDPIHLTDIVFERIEGSAGGGEPANYGIRVDHQRGGQIVDCVASGYRRGFYIDEQVDGLTLVRPVATDSAEYGISVEHPSRPPRNVRIQQPVVRGNGRDPQGSPASGVMIGRSENVSIEGGQIGLDAVQRLGVRISPEAINPRASGIAGQLLSHY